LNIEDGEKEREEEEEEDGGDGGKSVRIYMNHEENERRQEGLRIHRTHLGGKRNACGFLIRK
jgi:hypothetical protein